MKTKYFMIMAAVAGISLAGCSTGDMVNVLPEDNSIHVSTEVGNTTSRAGMTTSDLTSFGMYIANTADDRYEYNNYKWVKDNNVWTSSFCSENGTLKSELMLWKNASTKVQVTAYAPYDVKRSNLASTLDKPYTISVGDQSDLKAIDYLYAQSDVTPGGEQTTTNDIYYDADESVKALHVKLQHRMSKLIIKFSLATEFNDAKNGDATVSNPIRNIEIGNIAYTADWTLNTNTLTLAELGNLDLADSNFDSYTPGVGTSSDAKTLTGGKAVYECILIPQTTNDFAIVFEINGFSYIWKSSDKITFEGGKVYTLPLTVGKDMVTAGTWNIADWGTTGDTTIETD